MRHAPDAPPPPAAVERHPVERHAQAANRAERAAKGERSGVSLAGCRGPRREKEELLIPKEDLNRVWVLRKVLTPLSPTEAMELLLSKMSKTKTNADFLAAMASGKT